MLNHLYNLATDRYNGFGPSIIKFFLFILSLAYGLTVKILIYFSRSNQRRINCKVISVGNITPGGTGKTVLVEFIARYLKQQGHKVAILSRGYKRNKAADNEISTMDSKAMGDEPYMLSRSLGDVPVIVDADRVRAGELVIDKYGVDTVILDDAFQQWKIKKDLEIVTIDANNPFGNRHLMPRGLLREPLSSLKRADVFVLTKVNLKGDVQDTENFLRRINSDALIFESAHKPAGFYDINKPEELLNADMLSLTAVALVSGIGDPQSFENLIRGLGIDFGLSFRFADHHNYTQEDLNRITLNCEAKKIDTVVTTEKDMVRLEGLSLSACKLRILVLRINLGFINDEQGFHNRLLKLYSL